MEFAEHLRFGVPSTAGRSLAAEGIRHRRAYVELGDALALNPSAGRDRTGVLIAARQVLHEKRDQWIQRWGNLVFLNTDRDLSSAVSRIGIEFFE